MQRVGTLTPCRSRVSCTQLVKEGNFLILINVIYRNPTANYIILNSERLKAFPLKSKTSMSALFTSIQLIVILQTIYARHEPDILSAWIFTVALWDSSMKENTCTDLPRVIPAINNTEKVGDEDCSFYLGVLFFIDSFACSVKSFNHLLSFLLFIAFSLTQHLVVESLMWPGAPQTTFCKFLPGKPAFVCGSIPGFLKYIYLETKQKKATVISVFR